MNPLHNFPLLFDFVKPLASEPIDAFKWVCRECGFRADTQAEAETHTIQAGQTMEEPNPTYVLVNDPNLPYTVVDTPTV